MGSHSRLNLAPVNFSEDKDMKREGRGTTEMYVDETDSVEVVKWYDIKPILMASSKFGIEPQVTCLWLVEK